MAEYKISLGVQLQTDDIISQINEAERKVDPIKIKVDAETKELTQSIQDALKTLSKGGQNALTLDTSKFEGSIADIKSAVMDLKKVLGSLDDSANMKSLLASVNQIANAIGKVTDESETLAKSLSVLSKKDFGFNFNLKTGNANPLKAATDYGKEARRHAIPALQDQAAALQNLLGGYQQADKALERYLTKIHKASGISIKNNLVDDMSNTSSLAKQMEAIEKYIGYLKKIATEKGINLSGFDTQFSKTAENIVDDTTKIQTGAKQTEEALEAVGKEMKQVFGGGIGAEQLSAELEPIITDLNAIREVIQNLSKETSLGGLTASFDRLSGAIETLIQNATLAKQVLRDGLGGSTSVDTSAINKIETASDDSTAAVIQNEKKKQQAYKATADAVLYHAGVISKLNKAETNGRFYGSNRGTGYFGTGHYFVDSATKHELDNNGYYNKMPYTSVDISQYDNLFKATTDEAADRLHTFLANLTSFTQGSDNYDVSELFAQFKNVFGDTIMDVKEFGSRLDQLKAFMSNSSLDDRSDSVSTQFMKSLGYEGVDTRGTRYADTRYGTVIYDLKEESILQANITDELQKQGQMLEKINYAKGQVFDKGEDERIQGILDQQAKKREIAEEFQNSFDTTNLKNVDADLTSAKNRLKEIDEIIYDVQYGMDNAEQEVRKFAKEMSDFGLDMSEDEIKEEIQRRTKNYGEAIDELTKEKAELQSKIPILEETYNKEQQLANEAYKQAEQTVEQRHREAQQAQETANAVVQGEERKQQAYRETADAVEQVSKIKSSDVGQFDDDTADTKELNAELKKLETLARKIGQLDFKIVKSDYNDEVNQVREFERQLELLKKRYSETVKSLSSQSIDIGSVTIPEFVEARNKIAEFEAKIDDTKRKLAEKLQLKLDSGDFSAQVAKVESDANKLSGTYDEVEKSIKEVNAALASMQSASADNDIERLISANNKYEDALKKVENQLKQNKIAEQNVAAQQKLNDDIGLFQSKIDAWLTKNSAAAKQFGSTMLDLQARAEGCDRTTLNHLEAEFKQVDRAAEAAGKKTQTLGDSLKAQFSKYSTYFGVAELFMWVEQGLRDMFEQVQLIDTAMTELKKVTDETDASYNQFLSNAASRSKELGTTIDGLVSSTADFARLGYSFEESQGLAEVANVYAVVGDEIDGVEGATESLVSTLAAFKDELSGISDTDFAMDIIDKFNEVSNNFAISSGGIGEAMQRSASSLRAANNTIDESIALITAAM